MLDIVFISYDEPNAESNWKKLKDKFPFAKRVHGVKGIANAHIAASKKASTSFFYVLDGDSSIVDSFNLDFKPDIYESEYVHIWNAFNPACGLTYGYGGLKLFNKKFFKEVKSQLDFSTTLTKHVKYHDEVASHTHFNSDAFHAFRGAVRESVKLYITSNDPKNNEVVRTEAYDRLDKWENPPKSAAYYEYIVAGCIAGIEFVNEFKPKDLMFINDMDILLGLFVKYFPKVDLSLDPTPKDSNPMKQEAFFTSRIASALYDPYVLENLPVTELRDALSDGQMYSKLWLIEELKSLIDVGTIQPTRGLKYHPRRFSTAITGGWIGTLALMFNAWELPVDITSIDLDQRANSIAEKLNYDFQFRTITGDMFDVDYNEFDIIVNTSSEHIDDIPEWAASLPKGKIVVIQNNNYLAGDGHVSTANSSSELQALLNLKEVYYEGTRCFAQYDRYMIIGRT